MIILVFFIKNKKYYFNIDAIRIPYDEETKKARTRSIFIGAKWLEMGYNPKDLWSVTRIHKQDPEREDHPTQKPLEIIDRIIKASSPENGIILDPFMGSGTTAIACLKNKRNYIGFEINPLYCEIINKRITNFNSNLFTLTQTPTNNKIEQTDLLQFMYKG